MTAFSIEYVLASHYIERVFVSADSEKDRQIALSFGAEAPFLRKAKYPQDLSLDIAVFKDALFWLKTHLWIFFTAKPCWKNLMT